MSAVIAAVTRTDVANYVITLVYVYVILIFIRILMTFLPRIPYNRPLDIVLSFVFFFFSYFFFFGWFF